MNALMNTDKYFKNFLVGADAQQVWDILHRENVREFLSNNLPLFKTDLPDSVQSHPYLITLHTEGLPCLCPGLCHTLKGPCHPIKPHKVGPLLHDHGFRS